ncbi:MAG: DUF3858 domain-containing protein, partial [Candidatus Omnitrophica bacterium]|nr:DUF3858 domain-containing protein [Candidatus Omnitrophota bacterium]
RIMPQLAGLGTSLVAKDKRKYAIEFEALDKKESFYEIQLPSAFTVKYIPPNIKEESPWFDFSVEYTYAKNKILVRQKEELKRNTVLVEEYPLFREFLKKTAKRIKQRIVLEQIKDAQK